MTPVPEAGLPGQVQAVLQRAAHVTRFHYHPAIGSTNEEALRLARAGAPHGTLVLADRQTAGRGRLGRSWDSPPGVGLWFSWVLRPGIPLARAFGVTAAAAVALVETVARTSGRVATIRWPNDVLCGDRKVSGLLAEAGGTAGTLDFVVLGVGLNVNQTEQHFPPAYRAEATSLALLAGRPVDRAAALATFLEAFEFLYPDLEAGGGRILDEWRRHMPMAGRHVSVTLADRACRGRVRELAADGGLVVEEEGGAVHTLHAGDVRLLRNEP